MDLPFDLTLYLWLLALIALVCAFVQIRLEKDDLRKKEKEIGRIMYETFVLREIGLRIGYELNITKILETIVSSLGKILSYSVVSYQLISLDQKKIESRVYLEEPVSKKSLDLMRDHMLLELNKIAPRSFVKDDVNEILSGTVIEGDDRDLLASLWITPIIINSTGLGVLAIGSRKEGQYQGEEMELLVNILAQANRAVNNLEKVIATENEKVTGMILSMADGAVMLDLDLNLLVINPAAEILLGLDPIKKPTMFEIAKVLADKIDLRSKVQESISSDRPVIIENLRAGGKISQLLISPVRDGQGKKTGVVIAFHDVTAEKELEKVREEFTAMMVHELRAPLTVVRGSADMFIKNPTMVENPNGQALLRTMFNSSSTMLTLVNDLLDVAKIEAGKFQVMRVRGNMADLVSDRVLFFDQLAKQKSIQMIVNVDSSISDVEFDRDRITQVLNNLISNAIKFTGSGGKIEVFCRRALAPYDLTWRFGENGLVVRNFPVIIVGVVDSGVGISKDKIPDLFSKFKQLRPATEGQLGSGLGLAISKGIIESHGGQILVESKEGEGSGFYFTIPLDI